MKQNLKNIFLGSFFITFSGVMLTLFLPLYLKEKGLTILEIGALLTVGLALGGFIFSVFYSKFLMKTKLKIGLNLSSLFAFLQSFVIFIFLSSFGALISNFVNVFTNASSSISQDVAIQHNVPKNKHRLISSLYLVIGSLGLLSGIIVAYFILKNIGFRYGFLTFAIVALLSMYFYSKVHDKTRFRLKKKTKLPKITFNLKLVLFSELIYWFALSSSSSLVVTFLVTDLFKGSSFWIAGLFAGLHFSIVITTILTYKYFDKFNLVKTSIIGMFIILLSALLVIFSKSIYFVLVAMILEGIGAAIWVPSKSAFYWKLIKPENREKISGYLFGWRGMTNALGPLMGGFLAFYFGILAPFYFKMIIAFLVILIYFYVLRKT